METPVERAPALGVLAGGRSTRFPGGKLLAVFHGEPLLERVLRRVAGASDRCYLLGEPPGGTPEGWIPLEDPPGLEGPLAGFAALAGRSPAGFLVVGGDMPFLEEEPLRRLWKCSEGHPAACLEFEGRLHPLLAALRPPGVEAILRAAAAAGSGRTPGPGKLLEEISARSVDPATLGLSPPACRRLAMDVDTPETLGEALALEDMEKR